MARIIQLEKLAYDYFKNKNSVIAIGFFDGVHLGHREIIKLCILKARKINGTSVILTFDRPPINIIKGKTYKKLITSYEDKLMLIEDLGVDFIVTAKFDVNFSRLEPDEFCKDILIERLHSKEIFIGAGFHFGKDAKGDEKFLRDFLKPYNINVNIVPLYKVNGIVVSSTAIRKYFLEGNIEKIKSLFGSYPQITGEVVRSSGKGKELGFPTANIDVYERFVIPGDGVYFGKVRLNDEKEQKPAVINVGDNPTFRANKKWVEVYILNFNRDIYGKKIRVSFIKRLRDEIKFENEKELVEQMKIDIKNANIFFNSRVDMV